MAEILVAHDSEQRGHELAQALRATGHDVIAATDAASVTDLIRTGRFAVIVATTNVPGLDVAATIEHAIRDNSPPEIILLVPALAGSGSAAEDIPERLFVVLQEPGNDVSRLQIAVGRALERRRMRGENERLVADLGQRLRDLEDARRKLTDLSERDSVTGLLNHGAIHDRLRQATMRPRGAAPVVMLADVDAFRSINETYGRAVGDDLLRYVAECLTAACPHGSDIARCAADEFMVVLHAGTAETAARIAEQVRSRAAEIPFKPRHGTAIPVPLSFGIADAAGAGPAVPALLSAAELALDTCKKRGGDRVSLHVVSGADADDNAGAPEYGVLDGLVTAIDNKDRYTRRHSEDVAVYAAMLGDAVGLPQESLDILRVAALLHDVGKIGMPDSILLKPAMLSSDEFETMKGHVTLSCHILQGLQDARDIVDAVAAHHERWDGSGYPQGLQGDSIPLLGRILAIADTCSAITISRRYRAGLPLSEAITEIERGAGTQFDPFLARLFVDLMRSRAEIPQVPSLRAA